MKAFLKFGCIREAILAGVDAATNSGPHARVRPSPKLIDAARMRARDRGGRKLIKTNVPGPRLALHLHYRDSRARDKHAYPTQVFETRVRNRRFHTHNQRFHTLLLRTRTPAYYV